jgi:hypothetical protein
LLKSIPAAGAACFILLSAPAYAADKPSLAVYGQLPTIEEVEISPDGTKLALILTNGEQRSLVVRQLGGGILGGVNAGPTKLRGVTWVGEDHLLMIASQTADVIGLAGPAREYYMATDFNLKTKKQTPLLRSQPSAMNVIIGPPMPRIIDNEPFVFLEGIQFIDNQGVDMLYRVNLRTNVTRAQDRGARIDTDGWLVDVDGKSVAQSTYDIKSGRGALLIKAGANWKKVDEADSPTGTYGISGLGRDGRSVLVWRRGDDDVLREYSRGGGREALPDDLDFDGLIHDPYNARLLGGYTLDGDELRYTFFNPAVQSAWYAAIKPFKDARVSLKSWSRDRKHVVIVLRRRARRPAQAYCPGRPQRPGSGPVGRGDVYDEPHARGDLAGAFAIKYKAADGLAISGYLTLPRERRTHEPAADRPGAWRPRRARRAGLRLVEPSPGLAGPAGPPA